ncbi:MAG: hypothetical protein AMXMBFR82_40010 [Candidatus Hydrogenedentota bacterium]
MDPHAKIRVGTAGWSYEDWKGVVYPKGMSRSLHPLTYLAQFMDTVEVNSSFYHPPNPKHTESWVRKVAENANFMFTFKLWKRFTHQRDTFATDAEVRQYQEGIAPVAGAGKLGAILIQFPWSFRRTRESRKWLAQVLDTFACYPLALEIRHESWNVPEVYEGLASREIAFCNIDQPVFSDSIKPSDKVTARVGYVRLHGRNAKDWFRKDAGRDDRYNYLYSRDELADWLTMVRRMRQRAKSIYVITNNHFEGQAVVNAFELKHALEDRPQPIPECLMDAYPRLRDIARR